MILYIGIHSSSFFDFSDVLRGMIYGKSVVGYFTFF